MDPTPGRWGPFWTPITPEAGSLFHAGQQLERAEGLEVLRAQQPTGRLGTPEHVGHAVAFFVDPRAEFVTGQVLLVDGGRSVGGTAAF